VDSDSTDPAPVRELRPIRTTSQPAPESADGPTARSSAAAIPVRAVLAERPSPVVFSAPQPSVPTVHIGVVEVHVAAPLPVPAPIVPQHPATQPAAAAPPIRLSRPTAHFGLAQG
jgi:hypothetical protein